jgi:phosphoglycerate dehydrogenase-like enzyme
VIRLRRPILQGEKRCKVLVSAPHALPVIGRYQEELAAGGCDIQVVPVAERLEETELLPLVADVDGIICGDDRITRRVIEAAPRLRVILKWGTGIDSIDLAAARDRGIAVCNTPDAFTAPVADTVMGYVLLFARRLDQLSADVHAGRWLRRPLTSLSECTLGIVGFGCCGKAVARRAAAFDMQVLAHDIRWVDSGFPGVTRVALEELLRRSDFVTLHADLNASSFHLLDEARIRQMKKSAFFINTARGSLVDEPALVAALQENRLAGAALDVFEVEPLPLVSPLRHLANVYLAPHTANGSPAAAERVHTITIRNVLMILGSSP